MLTLTPLLPKLFRPDLSSRAPDLGSLERGAVGRRSYHEELFQQFGELLDRQLGIAKNTAQSLRVEDLAGMKRNGGATS
jgi:hypothetical protein